MALNNEIVLRPRFNCELFKNHLSALEVFEGLQKSQSDFVVSRVDDHVFIRIPKRKQHFWSPQLHLEINEVDSNSAKLYGLFGPNPTLWTMFMFVHFFLAGIFIAFSIWTYTNWRLNNPFGIQIGAMIAIIFIWIGLYIMGRLGRTTGKPQMEELFEFMNQTLSEHQLIP